MAEMKVSRELARLRSLIENPEENAAAVLHTLYNLYKLTQGHELSTRTTDWLNQTASLFLSPEIRAVLVKLRLQSNAFQFAALNLIDINDVIDDLSNEELLKNSLPPKRFNRLCRELLKFEPVEQNVQSLSKLITIRNQEDVSLEINVVAASYTSCLVKWKPLFENESLFGYKIHFQELDPMDADVVRSLEYDVGFVEEYTIGSLLPNTSYCVEVMTGKGVNDARRSAVMKVSTPSLPRGEMFQCSQCEFSHKHRAGYAPHVATHWKRGPFKCDHCYYYGSYECNVTKHVKDFHKTLKETN